MEQKKIRRKNGFYEFKGKNVIQKVVTYFRSVGDEGKLWSFDKAYKYYATGIKFYKSQAFFKKNSILFCLFDLHNKFDKNAIQICSPLNMEKVGYVPKDFSSFIYNKLSDSCVMVCFCLKDTTERSCQTVFILMKRQETTLPNII